MGARQFSILSTALRRKLSQRFIQTIVHTVTPLYAFLIHSTPSTSTVLLSSQLRTQARRKSKLANAAFDGLDSQFEDGYFGESHFDL